MSSDRSLKTTVVSESLIVMFSVVMELVLSFSVNPTASSIYLYRGGIHLSNFSA